MLILPGQLAFFFILSVVPIFTLISYGATYLNLSIDFIIEFISREFGSDIANLIIPAVTDTSLSKVLYYFIYWLYYCIKWCIIYDCYIKYYLWNQR